MRDNSTASAVSVSEQPVVLVKDGLENPRFVMHASSHLGMYIVKKCSILVDVSVCTQELTLVNMGLSTCQTRIASPVQERTSRHKVTSKGNKAGIENTEAHAILRNLSIDDDAIKYYFME